MNRTTRCRWRLRCSNSGPVACEPCDRVGPRCEPGPSAVGLTMAVADATLDAASTGLDEDGSRKSDGSTKPCVRRTGGIRPAQPSDWSCDPSPPGWDEVPCPALGHRLPRTSTAGCDARPHPHRRDAHDAAVRTARLRQDGRRRRLARVTGARSCLALARCRRQRSRPLRSLSARGPAGGPARDWRCH